MITCVLGTNKKVLSLQSGYPIINKSGGGLIFEHQIIKLIMAMVSILRNKDRVKHLTLPSFPIIRDQQSKTLRNAV